MELAALMIFAYFLGSIPFGLILTKAHGKDIRSIGSGNIGATNVSRALGKKWAYFCFLLDVLKGFIPTFMAMLVIGDRPELIEIVLVLCVGVMAVVGHIFPVYLNFKGGKGVATSLGFGLGIWPFFTIPAIIALVVWIITVGVSRYVSLASIVAGLGFVVVFLFAIFLNESWQMSRLWPLLLASVLIETLIVIRHRENIKRIIAGTESRAFGKNSKSNQSS